MLSLPPPKHSAKDTFEICISKFRQPFANHIKPATLAIVRAANDFDNAAKSGTIHNIPCHTKVIHNVTKDDMKKVYDRGMVGGPGRDIYNDIIASPPQGRCPLCMERDAKELDHYLPKAHFPSLAVAPLNLIPSCHDCNKTKRNKVAENAENVPLHPYYDKLGNDIWLVAKVIQSSPSALQFFTTQPSRWPSSFYKRVENHFASLDLAELFSIKAAQHLADIRQYLSSENDVKKHLQDMANSVAKTHRNSWKSAAYSAWSQCNWFYSGGFQS